jgi:hypothetical protein
MNDAFRYVVYTVSISTKTAYVFSVRTAQIYIGSVVTIPANCQTESSGKCKLRSRARCGDVGVSIWCVNQDAVYREWDLTAGFFQQTVLVAIGVYFHVLDEGDVCSVWYSVSVLLFLTDVEFLQSAWL